MTQEQNDSFEILKKFLNSCRSAKGTIELKPMAVERATNDYKVFSSSLAVSFILEEVTPVGICKIEKFGYKNPNASNIYEYLFLYEDCNNQLGCLAFHKNPNEREKIKWKIKSLHKDDLGRHLGVDKDVYWLDSENIKQLGYETNIFFLEESKNEVSSL